MGLRDLYYKMENGYYSVLDKLDKKGIPVYKVIDKIDKVIPSFIIVLILMGIILLIILLAILNAVGVFPGAPVSVQFTDKDGSAVPYASVVYFKGEEEFIGSTNGAGLLYLENVAKGDILDFQISYENDFDTSQLTISSEREYILELRFSLLKDSVSFHVSSADGTELKPINLEFICSNAYAQVPQPIYDSTNNDYSIDLDPICGTLSANITSSYYKEEIVNLQDGYNIILQPTDLGGNSSIIVSVYGSNNLPVYNYTATLSQNGTPIKNSSSNGSNPILTLGGLAKSQYTLTINASGYKTYSSVILVDNDTETVVVNLVESNQPKDLIVSVVNSTDSQLYGAVVTVYEMVGNSQGELLGSITTSLSNSGKAKFSANADKTYWVIVTKTGYSTKTRKNVSPGDLPITMYIGGNAKLFKVKVVDDLNKPISNAVVALYDSEENIVSPQLGITNANGIASGYVDDGNYIPYVYKGAYNGLGSAYYYDSSLDISEAYHTLVKMSIPMASWQITFKDKFGNLVPNALVRLYDAYSSTAVSVGNKYADPNGVFTANSLRADKKYFAVIEANSYENYITVGKYLIPNYTNEETIILEKEKLDKSMKIESIGITDLNGQKAIKLANGNEYVAHFKVSLPKGVLYEVDDDEIDSDNYGYNNLTTNFVIGNIETGSKSITSDNAFIKKVEYSGNPTLVKGQTYNESDIDETYNSMRDFDNEVYDGSAFEDEVKWLQTSWNLSDYDISSGILYVNVHIYIKETALDGETITIHYNAFAEDSEDELHYSPKDDYEDISESLFGNKDDAIYPIGEGQQICDSQFCFESTIYDIEEELISSIYGTTPYIAEVGKKYNLKFNLLNNNATPLTQYRIILENPQQNIKIVYGDMAFDLEDNTIDLDNNNFEDLFEFVFRDTSFGDWYQNRVLKGNFNIIPISEGSSSFKITIIEDKEIIYTKEFYITVVANKELTVDMTPETLPSYVDSNIEFTIKDADTNKFLNSTEIIIVDVYDTILTTGITDEYGYAKLLLPSQLPNIDLRIKIYKEGYKAIEKKVKTSDAFIITDPEELKVIAKITEGNGVGILKITNTSDLPVKIVKMEVDGYFDEYVNLTETNNYLKNSAENKVLESKSFLNVPVKVSLTTIAKLLESSIEYSDAKVKIYYAPVNEDLDYNSPSDYGTWEYAIPLTLKISLGAGLDDLSCLTLSTNKSQMVGNNGKSDSDELTIVNGCSVNGVPVEMINLEARVKWKDSPLGTFNFNRQETTSKIQSAYYVTLSPTIDQHEEQTYIVDFMPMNGRVAGNGIAVITVRASYYTDKGIEFVEDTVEYSANVVDMMSCISYTMPNEEVDFISIPRDSKGQFTIKNECDVDIDLMLTIMPDNFLDIRPVELSLPAKASKPVSISANTSPVGVYLLEVRGKTDKDNVSGIKTGDNALRVFIAPLETDCLFLDNYEFNFYNTEYGDYNSENDNEINSRYVYVINKCLYQEVNGIYNLKVTTGFKNNECASENFEGWLTSISSVATSAMLGSALGETLNQGTQGAYCKTTDDTTSNCKSGLKCEGNKCVKIVK